MTDAELTAIEAAARAATPGPWYIKRGYCLYDERDMHIVSAWENYSGSLGLTIDSHQAMANAMFLEDTNPAAILELIAELRQAKAERDWLAKYIIEHGRCPSRDVWEKCTAEQGETDKCIACWLQAAKEAVCQK